MKKKMGWTLVAVVAVAGLALSGGGDAAAMAGRCKQRNSSKEGWALNGLTFETCKERNQAKDGDNVFDEQGLVWWDVRA